LLDIQRDRSDRPRGDHILLLAAHRDDLILRYFTVAASLDLPSPEIRLDGALRGIAPGSPLTIELSGNPNRRSFIVNGVAHHVPGFTLGMGWTVLLHSEYLPLWLRELLNMAWMAAWTFPAGFWSRTRSAYLGSVVILGTGILILPSVTGMLVVTPPPQWAAAALGFLSGVVVRFRLPFR
jgi:hypothetical protein